MIVKTTTPKTLRNRFTPSNISSQAQVKIAPKEIRLIISPNNFGIGKNNNKSVTNHTIIGRFGV